MNNTIRALYRALKEVARAGSATLSHAEILTSPTEHRQIIPAPGANRMNVVLSAYFVTKFYEAYTNVAPGASSYGELALHYESGYEAGLIALENFNQETSPGHNTFQGNFSAFFGNTGTRLTHLAPKVPQYAWATMVEDSEAFPLSSQLSIVTKQNGGAYTSLDVAAGVNQAVVLRVWNGDETSSNFTGGNAANAMRVGVLYHVLEVEL